jgi:hypothetical protein
MDEKADVSILETGDGVVPRIKLGEQGYTGLQVSNGQIYEEANRELRWPNSIKTFKKMSRDATISADLYFLLLSNPPNIYLKSPFTSISRCEYPQL